MLLSPCRSSSAVDVPLGCRFFEGARAMRRNKKKPTFYVAYFEDAEHYEALRAVDDTPMSEGPSSLLGVAASELQVTYEWYRWMFVRLEHAVFCSRGSYAI